MLSSMKSKYLHFISFCGLHAIPKVRFFPQDFDSSGKLFHCTFWPLSSSFKESIAVVQWCRRTPTRTSRGGGGGGVSSPSSGAWGGAPFFPLASFLSSFPPLPSAGIKQSTAWCHKVSEAYICSCTKIWRSLLWVFFGFFSVQWV